MPPVIAFDADVLGRRRTGDETVTRQLLRAFGTLDLPFQVLAYVRDPNDVPPEATASGAVVPVRVGVGSNYARGGVALPARLATDRPALYHGLYLLPPLLPGPGVVTVADASYLRTGAYMPRIDRAAFSRFVPWSARRAARVVTPSEHARRDLLELVPGLDPSRVVAVPWGVSPDDFHPVPDAAARVARRFGLDRPYVLFLGALQPRKNLTRLLEAWAIRRARSPAADEILVLAGAPRSPGDALDDVVERLDLAPSVRRLGYVEGTDALRDLLAGARALAFPSLYEGFGLPAVEAMACGTPVLASDATALPETTAGAALLVDALAPASLADGLAALLDDDAAHARHRAAGLVRAAELTWERAAERLAGLWGEVIHEAAPRRRLPRPSPGMAPALVTASIVSTGEADRLRPCLEALEAQGLGADLRVVVVCNSPGDGSARLVREAFPSAVVVEQTDRRGFAENHNTGLAMRPSRYGLILNPDVVLDPGCLRGLLDAAEADPRCGVVVPALRYPDGTAQPSARRFPTPAGTLVRRTPLRRVFPPDRFSARHYLGAPAADREIDWALGACLLVRRTAWDEVGGFDEGFRPLYVEDIDLAWRLRQAGWTVRQASAATARHEHQAATDSTFLTRRTLWHAHGMARFVRAHPTVLLGYRPGPEARAGDDR
jgi:GT2 family glycosyltransferase/glycosyltransferase involved in cell wall biosynthesis